MLALLDFLIQSLTQSAIICLHFLIVLLAFGQLFL
jgi:hypothetical protein